MALPTNLHRIGFLADTHSRKADGSDLSEAVLDAFRGVDLIVHLGDIGQKGILARLEAVAPVLVPAGDNKGYIRWNETDGEPLKVIESAGVSIGIVFNLANPDKAVVVGERGLEFQKPLPDLLKRRFGRVVDVVASAGTHTQRLEEHEGVLFFDPGSPTLPSDKQSEDDLGSVAVLEVRDGRTHVDHVRLSR